MAIPITVPRLGWSMEEGIFVEWLKADGAEVRAGDPLFVLEGEKAAQEIEAVDCGRLCVPPDAPQRGATVAVGTLLGYLLEPGESPPGSPVAAPPVTPPVEQAASAASAAPAAAPSVRRLARRLGVDLSQLAAHGRVTSDDVWAAHGEKTAAHTPPAPQPTAAPVPPPRRRRAITPRAARVAAELGVDSTRVTGTGKGGRIREADIRQAAAGGPAPLTTTVHARSVRATIATRLMTSLSNTAPVTLTMRADVTNLVSMRRQFETAEPSGSPSAKPGYHDLFVKLVTLALEQHPLLNQRADATGTPGIHIGLAVDTDAGLVVPVIRDADRLTLRELAEQSRALIERARLGQLNLNDMQGSTFTLTNLGMYGIEAFTPIINYPETAILGLGAIRREATVAPDDRLVPRDMIMLNLTFDHRLVDGAPAARFLQTLRAGIENPAAWLIR